VDKIRKLILEFLLAHAPNSPQLQELAQEYGADRDRFEKEASFCILCGLCVRYCAEVKKKNAVGYVDCGARREIQFIPEIAAKECHSCSVLFFTPFRTVPALVERRFDVEIHMDLRAQT
jgi:predicted molibdopterin-dependent oxidoreductase YjgC